jgi:hypothetical protein
VPPLAERERPGLSETLTGPRLPWRCQGCGVTHAKENPLGRWLESDAWDRPQTPPVVVVLCQACSAREIEPHPRLYTQLDQHEPLPGCMSVCFYCVHRHGVTCRSLVAKQNGGPGLAYGWKDGAKPTVAFLCGRGCRRLTMWPGRVETCSGHARVALDVPARERASGE